MIHDLKQTEVNGKAPTTYIDLMGLGSDPKSLRMGYDVSRYEVRGNAVSCSDKESTRVKQICRINGIKTAHQHKLWVMIILSLIFVIDTEKLPY